MSKILKFRYLLFPIILTIEIRLYDSFYVVGKAKALSEFSSTPLIPAMGMLVIIGVTLCCERFFNHKDTLLFNAIIKLSFLGIGILYFFSLLPLHKSYEATLSLICIFSFLLFSLIRDVCLLLRQRNKYIQ